MNINLENAARSLDKYRAMMSPNHVHLITQENSDYFAFGAGTNATAVGYILVRTIPKESMSNVIALEIDQKLAGIGLEEVLLDAVEKKLREKNYHTLTFDCIFQENEPVSKAFLSPQEGWGKGELLSHIYTGNLQGISRAPWVTKQRLPKGFEFFSWDELTTGEREYIATGGDQWYPSKLSPLQEAHLMNAQLSVGLRYQGSIVGWKIVQRTARNMVLFKTQFIRDEYRSLGRGVLLIAEGIRKTIRVEGMEYGMFVVEKENNDMLQFTNRHFAPYIIRRKSLFSFRKVLA
ncbi:hypothetical protein BRE01_45770 [Brevibacillus reuszeri]|uniref:N-acetyltransferase domain-containing protein n=1 Tax=Brevibacillus reuszeri TaxID=54915 RepID=A0ABQ0TSI3_9BACL|nr:hypothetical protein [Brevibacillus reuszeri]MED1860236.1 hypothetical protein [Brevibacillus reuszeri]GED70875.1 hypothetical protein BRE01_45770 [Brevibacillus reuszeri]